MYRYSLMVWFLLGTTGFSLEFESEVIEHKTAPGETEYTARFAFKNTSKNNVTITKIDTDCGCLRAESDKKTYAPGESGVVSAVFTIGSKEGVEEKKVWVATDEVERPGKKGTPDLLFSRTLRVRLDIPKILDIKPAIVKWFVGEKPATKTIDLNVVGEDPLRITRVKSSRENIKVELEEVEAEKKYRIHITPQTTAKQQLGMLTINTNSTIPKHAKKMAFIVIETRPLKKR